MHIPRVFFSFTTQGPRDELKLIRAFLLRLKEQKGLDPWIFESYQQGISIGDPIVERCLAEIDKSDLFIAVVTRSAFKSGVTIKEISHALTRYRMGQLKIMPVICGLLPTNHWPEPFLSLKAIMYRKLRTFDEIEGCVEDACRILSVAYDPKASYPTRLPLVPRLYAELVEKTFVNKNRGHRAQADIEILNSLSTKCVNQYCGGDLEASYREVTAILTLLDTFYPGEVFYYPNIVKNVIRTEMARGDFQRLNEIKLEFENLMRHPLTDANAYGGAAHIANLLNRPEEALSYYKRAEKKLDGPDPAITYNLLLTSMMCSLPIDRTELREKVAVMRNGLPTREPGNMGRLKLIYALAYAYGGNTEISLELIEEIDDNEIVPFDLLAPFIEKMIGLSKAGLNRKYLSSALAVLEKIFKFPRVPEVVKIRMMHHRARIQHYLNDRRASVKNYRELARSQCLSPRILIDTAIILVDSGRVREGKKIFTKVAEMESVSETEPREDEKSFFYFKGFAHWYLGEKHRAKKCYQLSNGVSGAWYDETHRWLRNP